MADSNETTLYVHKGATTQMILTYTDKLGKRHAHSLDLSEHGSTQLLVRTAKWAAHNGITLTLRPM